MNCTNTMYCWTPGTAQVALVPWPDPERKSRKYESSLGACMSSMHEMTFEERQITLLADAMAMIVRDKCDPLAVHRALMGLEEYSAAMAPDMPQG